MYAAPIAFEALLVVMLRRLAPGFRAGVCFGSAAAALCCRWIAWRVPPATPTPTSRPWETSSDLGRRDLSS